jgi:hypothetical protein
MTVHVAFSILAGYVHAIVALYQDVNSQLIKIRLRCDGTSRELF